MTDEPTIPMKSILFLTALFATSVASSQPLVVMHALEFEHYVAPWVKARELMSGLPVGRVSIAVQCDAEGRPVDSLVLAYSSRDLARSTAEAVQAWRFAPVRVNGLPAGGQRVFNFEFRGPDVVSFTTSSEQLEVLFNRMGFGRYEYRPCSLRALDRIPLPLNTVTPTFPEGASARGLRGTVEVKFYIDEKGVVRLPAVVSADYVELAEAALAAVRQWKFEPPTSHGEPVLIIAQQRFDFGLTQPNPKADAPQTPAPETAGSF